jgi:hypothetical protein
MTGITRAERLARQDAAQSTETAAVGAVPKAQRRRRSSNGGMQLKLQAPQRDGYVRRWVNDNPARIQNMQELGYDFRRGRDQDGRPRNPDQPYRRHKARRLAAPRLPHGDSRRGVRLGVQDKEERLKPFEQAIRAGRDPEGKLTDLRAARPQLDFPHRLGPEGPGYNKGPPQWLTLMRRRACALSGTFPAPPTTAPSTLLRRRRRRHGPLSRRSRQVRRHLPDHQRGRLLRRVRAATGDVIVGAVVGVVPATSTSLPYRAASTQRILLVADDPNLLFEAQEITGGTPFVADDIGLNCNFVVGSGSTVTGKSGTGLDNSTEATTNTLDLRIWGLVNRADNAWATAPSTSSRSTAAPSPTKSLASKGA